MEFNVSPDCLTSLHQSNYFNIDNNNAGSVPSVPNLLDCEVALNEVKIEHTGEYQIMNGGLDKASSALSHQSVELDYLNSIFLKKIQLLAGQWKNQENGSKLRRPFRWSFNNSLLKKYAKGHYTQAFLFFDLVPPPKKWLKGLNRRAEHSIQLVEEKVNLLHKFQPSMNQLTKVSLQTLLDIVLYKGLVNFGHGEKSE